jgi:predicted PurR-regulated permease PerM
LLEGLYSSKNICVITIVVLVIFLVWRIFALFDLAHIQNLSQEKNLVNNQIENLLNHLRETRGDFTYTSIIEDLLQIYNTPIISQELKDEALKLMFEFFPDVMEMENQEELENTLNLFRNYLLGAI